MKPRFRRFSIVVLAVLSVLAYTGGCSFLPTAPSDPEGYCSAMGPQWYYCNTPLVTPNPPLPHGWQGFCDMSLDATGLVGYVGVKNGGATQVWASAQDLDLYCYPPPVYGRSVEPRCSSIVRCTRH